jgi:hypothetical protein
MSSAEFLTALKKLNWLIDQNVQNLPRGYDFNEIADGKFREAPNELRELVRSFTTCTNPQENIWLLSIVDYLGQSDSAFSWNEFERESLEVAGPNEITTIKNFWSAHLPFIMSVKNGYAYIAVALSGKNSGSVVIGNEPEYENTSKLSSNLTEFFDLFISFLQGETNIPALNILK